MFNRSWGKSDWLASRVDKWLAQCQGYSKLRSRRLSKGCQTMLDRPSPMGQSTAAHTDDNMNVNFASLTLNEESDQQMNFFQKQEQYDQDIANYIAYLNKPVINLNDHYIEIHQYHYEPNSFLQGEVPIRPPTRRKKHRINMKRTEVVENKGISTVQSQEYCEFLVKKGSDLNRNIRIVSGKSSDEENKKPDEDLDRHRQLRQTSPGVVEDKRVDTVVNKEGHVTVQRNQTFSFVAEDSKRNELPLRGFMSFRTTRKNKSGRRKKVVVGERGLDGPIWPGVLLTFDRSISPGPPEPPTESLA